MSDAGSAISGPSGALVVPVGVWIVLLLAGAIGVVMSKSVFGRHVYAIGSNEDAARLCGIRVPFVKVWIYTLAGALFGFAGVLQFARLTQGDPTVAIGLELDVIAAVVLGGASLAGGTGSVLGAMIGALIMAVLRNGSNQMGWPNYVQEIIIGGVIILVVAWINCVCKGVVEMPTRPDFIGHWSQFEDAEAHHYRGDEEKMGFDASIGEKLGLTRIGIHHLRVPPGRRISYPHAESAEEEFVFVVAGHPDAWIDGELFPLQPGDSVAFPAWHRHLPHVFEQHA